MRLVLTLLLSILFAGSALAGPFEDASDAYEREDYATAVRLLRPLAERGDAAAQFQLGVMYDNGIGVRQNHAEAAKWYRLAAEQGNVAAHIACGGWLCGLN